MDTFARLAAYFLAVDPLHTVDVVSTPFGNGECVPGVVATALLSCTPATFQPAPSGPAVRHVVLSRHSPLTDILENLNTNALGFDPDAAAATMAEAEAFRASLVTNCAVTTCWNGHAVAAGMFTPPIEGIAEVVGITTLPAYRRQGFGAAVTSAIVRSAFATGVEMAILRTDNPEARRIYVRLGFGEVGWLLSRPQEQSEQPE